VRKELEDSLRRLESDASTSTRFTGRSRGDSRAAPTSKRAEHAAALQKEGKVRHIGVELRRREMERIRPVAPIASLQPPYSMLPRIEATSCLIAWRTASA